MPPECPYCWAGLCPICQPEQYRERGKSTMLPPPGDADAHETFYANPVSDTIPVEPPTEPSITYFDEDDDGGAFEPTGTDGEL